MPNSFLKPEIIASVMMERLRRELILPRLVSRLGQSEFRGAKNDTVNVRVPSILAAREYNWRNDRSSPIVTDTIEEESIPVVLNKMPYSAVPCTDEEMTLDIMDFARQVLEPQVIAVAEKLESYIATAMVGANYAAAAVDYTESSDGSGAPFYRALVDARKVLNDANIPASGRFVVLGSSVEAAALKEDGFRKVNEAGSNDALRNAIIGRVAGFTVVGNVQSLPEDFALAGHSSAFAFANIAPIVPAGVTFGQGLALDGLAMRWIRDYDAAHLQDRSIVSSFAGASSVNDARDDHGEILTGEAAANIRAVLIDFTPAGS